jgi:hypothetical protein
MKTNLICYALLLLFSFHGFSQNPIIRNQFSADPTARVFGGKVYLYPSHDIRAKSGQGRPDWFCMADYHVFSSTNLTDWTDHGVILSQEKVPWASPNAYSMWAPDCVEKNGKYYFYFPAPAKDTAVYGRGFSIGVAIADKPEGPYVPQPTPILKVRGIDPSVFIDNDGEAYLYWAMGEMYVAKLKSNMTELATEPQIIANLPKKGLKEGPFVFEHNGHYYFTYPHVENNIERLEYAMASSPMGPFTVTGVIMDESASGCWTNHHSIINFNNQSYLFYHNNDLSPKFDKNRSVRVDSLFFNADGSIVKVKQTLRGVGLSSATKPIEIDRFSAKSQEGIAIEFLDTTKVFDGWKAIFEKKEAWIQYNAVSFGKEKLKTVQLKTLAKQGGTVQIRLNSVSGKLLAEANIPKSDQWQTRNFKLSELPQGKQNLVFILKTDNPVEVDWAKFKN